MVDTDSQLITAVAVLPGNAPDNLGALELVEQKAPRRRPLKPFIRCCELRVLCEVASL